MNAHNNRFDFFTSRLNFIQVTNDQLINIKLWHYLSQFESHVYGVFLQYNRIKLDLRVPEPETFRSVPGAKAGLDIFFYILTWDKLKQIYKRIKTLMNSIQKSTSSIPENFIAEFKHWKRRIDHLFLEFKKEIRNEYVHPSLEPYSTGNIIMWGTIIIDGSGNIKAHAGKDWFALIKKEHFDRLQQLRVDFFDIFIKHFSQKPLAQELIKVRDYIEENIDSLIEELNKFKDAENLEGFNDLVYNFTMYEINLSKEGIQLSENTKQKFYSQLWSS